LKFIGSEQSEESSKDMGDEVNGTVILEYNYL
jgi:hypothetical protein